MIILCILAVIIDQFTWYESVGTFSIGLLFLGVVAKVIQNILFALGIKRHHSGLLLSALFMCLLCILSEIVANTLFMFSIFENKTAKFDFRNSSLIRCYIVLTGISFCVLETVSFRCLWLAHSRFVTVKSYQDQIVQDKLLRITRSDIVLVYEIGAGRFGKVFRAKLGSHKTIVAAKFLKDSASPEMYYWFLEEAILLKSLDHKNIINVVGICIDSRPIILCMEFMEGGTLVTFLGSHFARMTLSIFKLMSICLDVAYAAEYLEEKGFVHRDIAARNCLTHTTPENYTVQPLLVKLGDFGLARDVKSVEGCVYKSTNSPFPIPHTPPEGFQGIFSSKSDVWSLGVLIYEVFTWCAEPFGKCLDNSGLHKCPRAVRTMGDIEQLICYSRKSLLHTEAPCSSSITNHVNELLNLCWYYEPSLRPSCSELVFKMEGLLQTMDSSAPIFPQSKFNNFIPESENEDVLQKQDDNSRRHPTLLFQSSVTSAYSPMKVQRIGAKVEPTNREAVELNHIMPNQVYYEHVID